MGITFDQESKKIGKKKKKKKMKGGKNREKSIYFFLEIVSLPEIGECPSRPLARVASQGRRQWIILFSGT